MTDISMDCTKCEARIRKQERERIKKAIKEYSQNLSSIFRAVLEQDSFWQALEGKKE